MHTVSLDYTLTIDMKTYRALFFSAMIVVSLSSCSSNSTSPNQTILNPPGVPTPGTIAIRRTDSVFSTCHLIDTVQVLQTELNYQGKENVMSYSRNQHSASYIAYESNGDVSRYVTTQAPGSHSRWVRWPVAGGPPIPDTATILPNAVD